MEVYYCTPEGYETLKLKVEKLRNSDRKEVVSYMNEIAKEQGSAALSENVEYIQANEQLNILERKISLLNDKINSSKVIDINKIPENGKVVFGCTVSVYDINEDNNLKYKIVGEDEADIKELKISLNSPIARSLIGKMVGDEVDIETPSGERSLEVIKIEHI